MLRKLTQERLKELLHYDSEIGIFTWLKSGGGSKKGDIAGGINKPGYRTISVDHKRYNASRLAWLWMEGYLPENDVDHRNRIQHDNRWSNLRHVSHLCNMHNQKIYKNNTSGITGVDWSKEKQMWRTRIMISGKSFNLGYFSSRLSAARARWEAEVKHGFPNCNTTSSAYLYIREHTN